MKRILLLLIALIANFAVCGQVTNGTYNMEVHFVKGWGQVDEENGDSEPTFISKVQEDTGYDQNSLLSIADGASNSGSTCYYYSANSNFYGPTVDYNLGTFTNSSGRYDWNLMSYEDDGGSRCVKDNGDDDVSSIWNWKYAYSGVEASTWLEFEENIENGSYGTLKHAWRYTHGSAASDPLEFGTITSGTKSHTNTNRSAPSGASSSLGYNNHWGSNYGFSFKSGNDVTYKFSISSSKKVTISTDYSTTDFDTYLHLVRWNSNGTFNYLTGDDDGGSVSQTSKIIQDLCPGDYGIIVDGYDGSSKGDFHLTVGVSTLTVSPGTIARSGAQYICPNATLSTATNSVYASSTLGRVTYTWEKNTYNGSAWSGWSTTSGTGSSNSSLGNLGTNEAVAIRRKATDCGSSAYTDIVYYYKTTVTATAGSITGSKMIPNPQEISNGSISNYSSASASPSAIISWEKNDGGGWQTIPGATSQSYTLPSAISQTTEYRRKVKSSCTSPEVSSTTSPVEVKVINTNGIISGVVKDRNNAFGIGGITITATRTTSVEGGAVNKTYTDITSPSGTFSIPGVYYGDIAPGSGDAASFNVVPSKAGHGFDPDIQTVTVQQNNPTPPGITFLDTTGFVITGVISQECADCDGATVSAPKVFYLENVDIIEDGSAAGKTTDETGTYTTIKLFEGDYDIKPEYETHQFSPEETTVTVGGSGGVTTTGIDFKDTTTHVISGNVIINCTDFYIGQANITFSQVLPDKNGAPVLPTFTKTITTNSGSGAYSVRLPAAKYKVSVNSFSNVPQEKNLNGIEMAAFLNAYPDSIRVRDITNVDTTLNLYFHEKPQIQVTGLAGPCDGTSGLTGAIDLSSNPIFVQSEERTFTVKVWEGNPSKACPAVDSMLIMSTNIEVDDVPEQLDTMTTGGEVELTLVGGIPNIIPPHHKTLSFNFTDVWKREADPAIIYPVVTGIKANIGSFATVSPEIPIMILRDPPGDQSSSYWSQNNTTETSNRFYGKIGGSSEIWGKVKVGVETQNGLGVSIKSKVWGEIGGSLITSGSIKKSEEVTVSSTNSQAFATNNGTFVVGEKADVYIGAAMNLKYAVTNEVIYAPDTCSFYLKKFLMISNEGFATKYIYSEHHILTSLIPTLKSFRDQPSITQAEKDGYADQISVWEQIIENNKELKRKAKFVENISFDGSVGAITSSSSGTIKSTSTIEFDLAIDAGVATELGLEVGGAGVSGGVKMRMKMETGKSTVTTNTTTTTTGYTINDQNPGDFYTVDVKTDPVYGTPVFDLVAGTSSCPTETGAQPRYEVSLTSANPILSGIPANGTGIFEVKIGNTSQSEETRSYYIRHINASSNGATISKDGNPFIVPFEYNLNYLQQVPISIGVTRFNPNVYGFEDIRFEAYDACRGVNPAFPLSRKEISISAFFANGCSPITLSAPENGFVVSQANNNMLGLTMKDYDYNNLDNIVVEYAEKGTSSWIEAITIPKSQIQNSSFGTQISLDIAGLSDGEYNFRLKLKCGLDVVYSKRVYGTIDRKGPESFGLPQPSDDVYSLGDEISSEFNEKLACSSFNASNFTMTRLSNSTTVPAVLGCFNNKIVITPTIDILPFLGDSVRVNLVNINDQYGNPSLVDYSWKFFIGTPEIDATVPYYANLNPASSTSTSGSPSISSTPTSMDEDAIGTLNMNFSTSVAPTDSILVYFIVAGTASFGDDYTVSGAHTFDGNEGSIYIPKNGFYAQLSINPIADTDLESDETIILGILSGGDYNIGGSNKVTLTILNDDSDDCENGGSPFLVDNNASGNTAISAGEYHKSFLESDGDVQSPTTVIFKGEHSVTLKPGFEVQNGSVFLAILEDCPNLVTGGPSGGEKGARLATANTTAAPEFTTYTIENKARLDESKGIVQKIDKNGEILIPFASAFEQQFEISLLTTTASKKGDYNSDITYQSGVNTFSLDTNELEAGNYFLKFKGLRDKKESYHKLVVSGN
ncbi:3-coathanger stack domain-containing protein [Arcticibacterium luteifluviistationis]|uniref:Secretion system C-terminal sorting domain-containing protein n=1 Tax=Arcticibacterium luteifluviistationis TaxID=1784714 RepID=A0A2Z4G6I1_9BACT|nr:3-coathanger stack domain-containing protein [Arcticibacterium luteifluviistationis]AWV96767.1 hypothetical protein DJ013_00590 [Arcticibacterium luteifluviistationis]